MDMVETARYDSIAVTISDISSSYDRYYIVGMIDEQIICNLLISPTSDTYTVYAVLPQGSYNTTITVSWTIEGYTATEHEQVFSKTATYDIPDWPNVELWSWDHPESSATSTADERANLLAHLAPGQPVQMYHDPVTGELVPNFRATIWNDMVELAHIGMNNTREGWRPAYATLEGTKVTTNTRFSAKVFNSLVANIQASDWGWRTHPEYPGYLGRRYVAGLADFDTLGSIVREWKLVTTPDKIYAAYFKWTANGQTIYPLTDRLNRFLESVNNPQITGGCWTYLEMWVRYLQLATCHSIQLKELAPQTLRITTNGILSIELHWLYPVEIIPEVGGWQLFQHFAVEQVDANSLILY